MNWRFASLILALIAAGPALAQAPVKKTQQKPTSTAYVLQPGAEPQTATRSGATRPGGQEDSVRDAAIHKLLRLMGSANISTLMVEAAMPQVRSIVGSSVLPGEREKLMDDFSRKFRERITVDDIVNAETPIYGSHFSLKDIQVLTHFYESPVGQRFVGALPEISRESQAVGARIGRKALLDTLHEMSSEYPGLKKLAGGQDAK